MKIVINGETVEIPSGGGELAGETYSTEETRIGTWIDGKPLHRKVISTIFPGSAGNNLLLFSLDSSVDKLTKLEGFIYTSSHQYPVPYSNPSHDGVVTLTRWASSVYAHINMPGTVMSAFDGAAFPITIEYTKTTDRATAERSVMLANGSDNTLSVDSQFAPAAVTAGTAGLQTEEV